MSKKKDDPSNVISFVFMITFGLIMAVIVYVTFNGGFFALESKAASEDRILKQWTFDIGNEGWNAKDVLSSVVSNGMYLLTLNTVSRPETPRVIQSRVLTPLKYPINKFRMRLTVSTPPVRVIPPAGIDTKNQKIIPNPPIQQAYPFTIKVSVKYQGKPTNDAEQLISAVADGKEHEYSFLFPRTVNLKRIDELQVTFVGLKSVSKTIISINDIALIGMKSVSPTVTQVSPIPTSTYTFPSPVISKYPMGTPVPYITAAPER